MLEVIVADYSASNKDSFLSYLDELSVRRQDGGMLHGGHIHYIQRKLSDEDDVPFLKAAIKGVLDRVPNIFPLDLPERVEKDDDYEMTDEMHKAFWELNEGLIMPLYGYDIVRVILAAREYIEEEPND